MATTRDQHQIVETATEARQGEPGPSVAALLAISTGLAILILAVKGAVDHVTGVRQSLGELAIEIGVVLNNEQAHASLQK